MHGRRFRINSRVPLEPFVPRVQGSCEESKESHPIISIRFDWIVWSKVAHATVERSGKIARSR